MFLAQWWRLETSSRPLDDFNKWQYKKTFQFLVVDIYYF